MNGDSTTMLIGALGFLTARRKYAPALELFLLAITAPTHILSAIAVAAWKKFVVVSLIHDGGNPRMTTSYEICNFTSGIYVVTFSWPAQQWSGIEWFRHN